MRFIPGSQLIRRSDAELGALFRAFNEALARAEPLSEEWKDAQLSVENILSERRRRLNAPAPQLF
jgi:hypothetical protein